MGLSTEAFSMTTVAANLEGMASDSFIADGSRAKKIRIVTLSAYGLTGQAVVGYAGGLYYAELLVKWVEEGCRGMCPPWDDNFKMDDDDKASDTELLILHRKGLFTMDGRGLFVPVHHMYHAIGSGQDVALGAMFHGHSPIEAVDAACFHDLHTKAPVDYIALPAGRKRKGTE
jgi:ATP-dependent protease HslVU (ClpYQ) peptidase subunit